MSKKTYDLMHDHHIVPRSRGGTNVEKNIKKLKMNFHQSFHNIFSNQLFHEQMRTLLDLNDTALRTDFRQDLIHAIKNMEVEDIYEDECFKRKKIQRSYSSIIIP